MTTKDTKAPKKRRSISKANLLRELKVVVAECELDADSNIGQLVDAIKEDIVAEAMSR